MAISSETSPAAAGEQRAELRPVSAQENDELRGLALCCRGNFDAFMRDVAAARQRQARYTSTLPIDAEGAVEAALDLLHPDGDSYPNDFEAVVDQILLLEGALRDETFQDNDILINALPRIVTGITDSVRDLLDTLDRLGEVLTYRHRSADPVGGDGTGEARP